MRTILIIGNEGREVTSVVSELMRYQDVEIRLFSPIPPISCNDRVTWISGDPFSIESLMDGMKGVEKVYYFERLAVGPLKLVQGSSDIIELLIATNVSLAAKILGVRQVEFKKAKSNTSLVFPKIKLNSARSIQSFVLPHNKDAEWVGEEYFRWLPEFSSNIVKVKYDGDVCDFSFFNERFVILRLKKNKTITQSKISFDVIGGLLSSKQSKGKLEFTTSLDKRFVLGALLDFTPSLPWFFYRFGQAIVHILVMGAFKEHLNWIYITEDHK